MENGKLSGQNALVTGASSGIGRAAAIELAKAGANVMVHYHSNDQQAEQISGEIRDLGAKAFTFQANVSKEEDVMALFEETLSRLGRLDILVSNSGIQQDAPVLEMTFDQWRKVLSVNLDGAFLCSRQAARIFREQGVDEKRSPAAGKIIFMSSVHELIPWAGHINYAAAKGGVMMLMKTMAQELAPYKIRVNSVAPGAIKTPINEDVWKDDQKRKKLLTMIPYGRLGEPAEVAKSVVWLASDDADYIHGATIYIDGGMALYPSFAEGG